MNLQRFDESGCRAIMLAGTVEHGPERIQRLGHLDEVAVRIETRELAVCVQGFLLQRERPFEPFTIVVYHAREPKQHVIIGVVDEMRRRDLVRLLVPDVVLREFREGKRQTKHVLAVQDDVNKSSET
jgi:hypothetical protein